MTKRMKEDNINYIVKLGASVCRDVVLKCGATFLLVISEFLVDGVMAKAMLALFLLCLADWVTGVFAAHQTGDDIKSSKIVRTPIKIVIYFLLITCARISEYSLPDAVHFIDETIVAFLTLTEFISILENAGKLGYPTPTKLLNKLRNIRDDK